MNKKCPFCAEEILVDARKCRYCNEWLTDDNHPSQTKPKLIVKRRVVLGISLLLLITLFWNIGRDFLGLRTYYNNQTGLEQALERQNRLFDTGDEDSARELYRDFLLPQDRTITEDEYVKGFLEYKSKNPYSKTIQHGIKMADSIAYVDRTTLACNDKDCTSIIGKSRSYRKFYYENGHWYYQVRNVSCPRDSGYDMEPEFSRALSLITQRIFSYDEDVSNFYQEIIRCIDIQYASTNEEMSGAEGVFKFIPDQSTERLSIFVSPRYQAMDDLITATLLTHEVTHALGYISAMYSGMPLDCYADEAEAFYEQNRFLTSLNMEEKQSVYGRLVLGGSPELVGISDALVEIPKMRGSTYKEKALNYVKSNPAYQKQCSNFNPLEY